MSRVIRVVGALRLLQSIVLLCMASLSEARTARPPTPVALAQELLLLRHSSPQLVQIGAHFGDFNRSHHHSGINGDSARRAVYTLLGSNLTRALLLEPNPTAFAILDAGLRAHASFMPATIAVNAAVCPNETAVVDFHVVAPRFEREFPNAPYWARSELSSTIRDSILRGLWLVVQPKRPEDYTQTIKVPCYSPSDLLRTNRIEPRALDALVVDTEGLDAELVLAFLQVPGVQPGLIIFEAHIARRRHKHSLYTALRRRGYKLDCCGCETWVVQNKRDPLTAWNPVNKSQIKVCDSGLNAVAWDPAQLNLTAAVGRDRALQNWYQRLGRA